MYFPLEVSHQKPNATFNLRGIRSPDPVIKMILIPSSILRRETDDSLTCAEDTALLPELPSFMLYEQQESNEILQLHLLPAMSTFSEITGILLNAQP